MSSRHAQNWPTHGIVDIDLFKERWCSSAAMPELSIGKSAELHLLVICSTGFKGAPHSRLQRILHRGVCFKVLQRRLAELI